jgi:hypothetical protein
MHAYHRDKGIIVYNDSCLAATAFINREKSKSVYRWKEVTDEEGFPVAVVLCSKQQLSQPVVGTQGLWPEQSRKAGTERRR